DRDFPLNVQELVFAGCYHEIDRSRRGPKALREKRAPLLHQAAVYELPTRQTHALHARQLQPVFLALLLMRARLLYILHDPTAAYHYTRQRTPVDNSQSLL
ncbi:metal ABC transporter ATP-binding protein, partial [Staphylococcus pseudintermedius]